MSSFLFDTNALIYWTYQHSPFHEEVSKLLKASLQSKNSICALASSLKDVYFALCSHYTDEATARRSIALIAEVFDLVDLGMPSTQMNPTMRMVLSAQPPKRSMLMRSSPTTGKPSATPPSPS